MLALTEWESWLLDATSVSKLASPQSRGEDGTRRGKLSQLILHFSFTLMDWTAVCVLYWKLPLRCHQLRKLLSHRASLITKSSTEKVSFIHLFTKLVSGGSMYSPLQCLLLTIRLSLAQVLTLRVHWTLDWNDLKIRQPAYFFFYFYCLLLLSGWNLNSCILTNKCFTSILSA